MSSGAAAPAGSSQSCAAGRATAGSATGRGPAGPPRPCALGVLSTLRPPLRPASHRPAPPPAGKPLPPRSSLPLSDGMTSYLRPFRGLPPGSSTPLRQRVHLLRTRLGRHLAVPEHVGEQTVARQEPVPRGGAEGGGEAGPGVVSLAVDEHGARHRARAGQPDD